MENNYEEINLNSFQMDLIQSRYHLFDPNKSKTKDYYPKELLELISTLTSSHRKFEITIGDIYSTRAFFAISEPIDNKVEYQSGYLDLKLMIKENDNLMGEVVTSLPPGFVLQKGAKIKFKIENILYKPDYNSIKNKNV